MQVQKIGNYTTTFSTNKNQNKNQNSIEFGMTFDISGKEKEIENLVGKRGFKKVLAAIDEWNEPAKMLERFKKAWSGERFGSPYEPPKDYDETLIRILGVPVYKEKSHFKVSLIEDKKEGTPCLGFADGSLLSTKKELTDAFINTCDEALDDFAKTKILE